MKFRGNSLSAVTTVICRCLARFDLGFFVLLGFFLLKKRQKRKDRKERQKKFLSKRKKLNGRKLSDDNFRINVRFYEENKKYFFY